MTACIVKRVTAVEDHPNPEAASVNVVRVSDAQLVSGKVDNAPRYAVGDLVIHIPGGSILTDELQARLEAKEKKIRSANYKGFRSEGMLLPASEIPGSVEGQDVTADLGVTYKTA